LIKVLHFAAIINRHDFIDAVLTRLDRSRFQVRAITAMPPRRSEPYRDGEAYDTRCLQIPVSKSAYPVMLKALIREIRDFKPDVVHAHHFDESFVAALATRLLRVPALVIGHHYSDHIYFLSRGLRLEFNLAIEAFVNRTASRIVVPAQEVYTLLVDRQGVPAGKVQVIPYGLEFDRYHASTPDAPARLRERHGLGGRFVVLACCRLNREKGLDHLLRAIASMRAQAPDLSMVFVGDGSDRAALEALTRELDLSGVVTFIGWSNDALDWLATADVVVQPSLCESYCQVLVEALAFKKPVVMTPVGAGPDVIGANERGRLVPKADAPALAAALTELMTDRQLGQELGRRGFDFLQRTTQVDAVVRQHEQVYEDVLRNAGASKLVEVRH